MIFLLPQVQPTSHKLIRKVSSHCFRLSIISTENVRCMTSDNSTLKVVTDNKKISLSHRSLFGIAVGLRQMDKWRNKIAFVSRIKFRHWVGNFKGVGEGGSKCDRSGTSH